MKWKRAILLVLLPVVSFCILHLALSRRPFSHNAALAELPPPQSSADPVSVAAEVLRGELVSVVRAIANAPASAGNMQVEQQMFLVACAGCNRISPPPTAPALISDWKRRTKNEATSHHPHFGSDKQRDIVCRALADHGRFEPTIQDRVLWFLQELKRQIEPAMMSQRKAIASRVKLAGKVIRKRNGMERKHGDDDDGVAIPDDFRADAEEHFQTTETLFIDAGCNVGALSFGLAQLFDSVVAIDASSENLRLMQTTIAINSNKSFYEAMRNENLNEEATLRASAESELSVEDENMRKRAASRCFDTKSHFASKTATAAPAGAVAVPRGAFDRIRKVHAALVDASSGRVQTQRRCLLLNRRNNANNFRVVCEQKGRNDALIRAAKVGQKLDLSGTSNDEGDDVRDLIVQKIEHVPIMSLDTAIVAGLSQDGIAQSLRALRCKLVVLKMDIESSEMTVLFGGEGSSLLFIAPPAIIIAEQQQFRVQQTIEFLSLMSLRGYIIVHALTGKTIGQFDIASWVQSSMAAVENLFFVRDDLKRFLCREEFVAVAGHFSGKKQTTCGLSYVADRG